MTVACIDRAGARISNYFDGGNPGCRVRFVDHSKTEVENRIVRPRIILRRDKLCRGASVRVSHIFEGGDNKVDNNGPTSASTRDNFPRADVRKFFDVPRAPLLPTGN